MEIVQNIAWVFYVGDTEELDDNKIGKWMYFFYEGGREFVEKICSEAVLNDIVCESKHSNAEEGVCCFYLNIYDIERHKKIITYFMENNLIRKTKNGRYYNISFKLDNQTRAGEYGANFKAEVKLADFINLETGEWLV